MWWIATLKFRLHIIDCTRSYLWYFMFCSNDKQAEEEEKNSCYWNVRVKIPELKSEIGDTKFANQRSWTVKIFPCCMICRLSESYLPNLYMISGEISIVILSFQIHKRNFTIEFSSISLNLLHHFNRWTQRIGNFLSKFRWNFIEFLQNSFNWNANLIEKDKCKSATHTKKQMETHKFQTECKLKSSVKIQFVC